ncbi:SMP-30/gluconolactonase/LRE family protein [Actinomadura macrotermitis]|uniref:Virginiamycin B lyase n=1 Tax=Actinomadura macrotermitis TaxID=2585200 RepID=A0A7K0BTW7_9ACTN|nr:SMP-30/gluconolactonase/LRE family protein [Actinomadura macrotermitis]MQY04591.1 Virginiamycin B lyase [Actinomadura macrotermitis]
MPSVLLSDLAIPESPRWHEDRLWFANWGTGEIIAVSPTGEPEVMARTPGPLPYSFAWLPGGELRVISGPTASLLDASQNVVADLSHLSKGFNEIVIDARGNTYVNAVGFDMMAGEPPAPGIIALITPDGTARQVAADIAFGNGMAITPDGATLIVAESYANRLTAFTITQDGSLTNRRTWADVGDDHPDGICLDAEGAVWYADVGNRHCVRVAEGGKVLQTVEADQGCFACMLGGTTLFILTAAWTGAENILTAPRTGQILTTEAPAPHAGHP